VDSGEKEFSREGIANAWCYSLLPLAVPQLIYG